MLENEKYRRIGSCDPNIEKFLSLYKLAEDNSFHLECSPTKQGFFRLSARTKYSCRPVIGKLFDATYNDVKNYIANAVKSRERHR